MRLAADRFTLDAAKAIGRSERAIQLDVERGEKVSDEAMALVRHTALDTGSSLCFPSREPKGYGSGSIKFVGSPE